MILSSSIDDPIGIITTTVSGWPVVAEDEGNEIPAPTPQHKLDIPEKFGDVPPFSGAPDCL